LCTFFHPRMFHFHPQFHPILFLRSFVDLSLSRRLRSVAAVPRCCGECASPSSLCCSAACELLLLSLTPSLLWQIFLLIWLCLLKLEREGVHHHGSASEVGTGVALASISVLCWLMYA
jgi:hypothetical protein